MGKPKGELFVVPPHIPPVIPDSELPEFDEFEFDDDMIWKPTYNIYWLRHKTEKTYKGVPKGYIGVSYHSSAKRKKQHESEANQEIITSTDKTFYKHIIGDSVDIFYSSILEYDVSAEDRDARERYWIEQKYTHVDYGGYNKNYGGGGAIAGKEGRVIYIYDLDGVFVTGVLSLGCCNAWFDDQGLIPDGEVYKVSHPEITRALKKGSPAFGAYYLRYKTKTTRNYMPIVAINPENMEIVSSHHNSMEAARWVARLGPLYVKHGTSLKSSVAKDIRKAVQDYLIGGQSRVIYGFMWRPKSM